MSNLADLILHRYILNKIRFLKRDMLEEHLRSNRTEKSAL